MRREEHSGYSDSSRPLGEYLSYCRAFFPLVLERLKALVKWLVGPPAGMPADHPLTLAIPDARSTFDRGGVGLAERPTARVRCDACSKEFFHERGRDMIRCPRCPVERPPDRLADFELLELQCPVCGTSMEYGIRHPNLFDSPQWASCPECHYHWESNHSFSRPLIS